jgi:hypothetical protein
VAYLLCEGIPHGRRCPRDEALEGAVWPLLSALPACAAPPETPGEGDLRIDYRLDGPPEIAWRDMFADEVVRLDHDRLLACLREPLRATRQSLGAEHLVVSFRFRLE